MSESVVGIVLMLKSLEIDSKVAWQRDALRNIKLRAFQKPDPLHARTIHFRTPSVSKALFMHEQRFPMNRHPYPTPQVNRR